MHISSHNEKLQQFGCTLTDWIYKVMCNSWVRCLTLCNFPFSVVYFLVLMSVFVSDPLLLYTCFCLLLHLPYILGRPLVCLVSIMWVLVCFHAVPLCRLKCQSLCWPYRAIVLSLSHYLTSELCLDPCMCQLSPCVFTIACFVSSHNLAVSLCSKCKTTFRKCSRIKPNCWHGIK